MNIFIQRHFSLEQLPVTCSPVWANIARKNYDTSPSAFLGDGST